jgi:hypothetical protein
MSSKLDPQSPSTEWQDYYQAAASRRRRAGWHRRGETRAPKYKLDGGKLLAIVMGLATIIVILCLVLPV